MSLEKVILRAKETDQFSRAVLCFIWIAPVGNREPLNVNSTQNWPFFAGPLVEQYNTRNFY